MLKKRYLFILLFFLIPASLFASSTFGFKIGASALYDKNLGGIISDIETKEKLKASDFSFGLDADIQIMIVDVDMTAYYHKGVNEKFALGGIMSVNVGPNLGPMRLSFGLGFDWSYNIQVEGKFAFGSNYTDLGKNFANSPLNLRAAVEFTINPVFIKVYGVIPTNLTFASFKIGEMFKQFDYKNIKFGIVVGIDLFNNQ